MIQKATFSVDLYNYDELPTAQDIFFSSLIWTTFCVLLAPFTFVVPRNRSGRTQVMSTLPAMPGAGNGRGRPGTTFGANQNLAPMPFGATPFGGTNFNPPPFNSPAFPGTSPGAAAPGRSVRA